MSVHKIICYCYVFLPADEDDLHDVISAVTDLAGRWQHLGIALRLRSGDLESILSASAHSPSDCLRKLLTLWLKQNYNVCITLIYIPPPSHTHSMHAHTHMYTRTHTHTHIHTHTHTHTPFFFAMSLVTKWSR